MILAAQESPPLLKIKLSEGKMKVTFSCLKKHLGVIPSPVSAVKAAPDYFKSVKPQTNSDPGTSTVKRCLPFLDALSAGFIIPMWSDVWVFAKNGELQIDFPVGTSLDATLGQHGPEQIPNHPLSKKPYGNTPLKWINPWVVKTDPGISCLFTSPLNHLETRFKILDGVVDTDTYYNNINFPFIWSGGDGEFLIERGTPLVQVIPFRRETFELEVSVTDLDEVEKHSAIIGTKFKNAYREEFWHNRKNKDSNEGVVYSEKQSAFVDVSSPENLIPHQPVADVNTSADAKDHLDSSEWKSQSSSGILEVVPDGKGGGFGEGGF